jgi:hypothetical protein
MQKVTNLLNRFLHLVPKDRHIKEIALRVFTNTFPQGGPFSFEYQKNILFVRGTNALKHAIQIKKEDLLNAINKEGGERVKDIR